MKLEPGALLGDGRFRLIRSIGTGGMASVWSAHHELLGRDVALKLSPVDPSTPEAAARFVREAHIIGKFAHPNIVAVLDAGELRDDGYVFLVMELLRGEAFADRFVPGNRLDAREVLPILVDVCRGLEIAHEAGVVHRDVKPENVFLARAGEREIVKLIDFGISCAETRTPRDRITIDGQILGTPEYMSPEQARGDRDIDAGADLWAIGVMLHEAIAGAAPFGADSQYAMLRRIVEGEPEPLPLDVSEALRAIVAKCLEKDRTKRYTDAAALRVDLEAAITVRASSASVLPRIDRATRPRRRVAFAAALALSASAVALVLPHGAATPRGDRARAGIAVAAAGTVVESRADDPPVAGAPLAEPPDGSIDKPPALAPRPQAPRLTRITRPGF